MIRKPPVALLCCCLLYLTLLPTVAAADAAPPQVRIAQGVLRGGHQDGIDVFRGIPFAADTGGERRWHPPAAAPAWKGVRDATAAGPICPQSTQSRQGPPAPWLALFEMGEDCLNLTVYRPAAGAGAGAGNRLPVMLWIHGGSARVGSGSRHGGMDLAGEGVIVVTPNYRLDRLGLFAHPQLAIEQPDAPLGNYALMDLLAALQWVQANIDRFGGDPGNVTLFGQSSGGVAVTALMASPLAKGLFHRAIAQSGVMADLDRSRMLARDLPGSPSLQSDGLAMAKALAPEASGADVLPALRALPWQTIIAYSEGLPPAVMIPVIDGRVLTGSTMRGFAAGDSVPVPFMVGSNSWEQSLYQAFKLPLPMALGGVPAEQARAIYPGLDDAALAAQWLVDAQFHAPARFMADASATHGQPTWVYRFDHVPEASPGQPGAAHSDEVPFLLEPVGLPGSAPRAGEEARLANQLRAYWASFARSGDPNHAGLPAWPAWQPGGQGATQVLHVQTRSEAGLRQPVMDLHQARFQHALQATPP